MRQSYSVIVIIMLLASSNASAEVMDKEPSLTQNISWGLLSAVLFYIAARYKPWLLLLVMPVPILYFLALINEVRDPHVGPAILHEAGPMYIYSSYALAAFLVISVILGAWVRVRVRKKQHNQSLKPTPKSGAA